MAFKVLNDHDVNWVPIFNERNQDNKKTISRLLYAFGQLIFI